VRETRYILSGFTEKASLNLHEPESMLKAKYCNRLAHGEMNRQET
jgi:hypothetical protein